MITVERPIANAKVATVLGSIPASSGTVESEGAADEAVLNIVKKNIQKNLLFDIQRWVYSY